METGILGVVSDGAVVASPAMRAMVAVFIDIISSFGGAAPNGCPGGACPLFRRASRTRYRQRIIIVAVTGEHARANIMACDHAPSFSRSR